MTDPALALVQVKGAFSKGPQCAETGLEPTEAALTTAIFRAVQNPDGAFQRDPARPNVFPAGGWLWPLEGAGESRSCSRKGCCLRHFHGKNGEAADGEYWPGNSGTRSIKISNEEVIGTGCLVEDFDASNQAD